MFYINQALMCNKDKLAKHFQAFMTEMNLDLDDASLKDTPMRVAKMFVDETCKWLYENPPKITTFPNEWENAYNGIVLVKDIEVKSLCEHHFQPFIGKCHIAYIPGERVVGLSKFARIVDHFSRRPQVQERLTTQIYNFLVEVLKTDNIAIVISSEHFCMKIRGVEEPCSSTITSKMGWLFMHWEKTRDEFYQLLQQ